MSEKPAGVWCWLILIVVVNALWISMDLWLHAHGYEYLTTEFKEGLKSHKYSWLLGGLVGFTICAFLVHMWGS